MALRSSFNVGEAGDRLLQPNTRLKLAAPVVYSRTAFVIIHVRRRSLGAIR